jgi:hypothetical protein
MRWEGGEEVRVVWWCAIVMIICVCAQRRKKRECPSTLSSSKRCVLLSLLLFSPPSISLPFNILSLFYSPPSTRPAPPITSSFIPAPLHLIIIHRKSRVERIILRILLSSNSAPSSLHSPPLNYKGS